MDRGEGGGGGGVGRTAGEEEEEASMALDPELVRRLKKFAVRFSVRMGGGQGGGGGRTHLLLAFGHSTIGRTSRSRRRTVSTPTTGSRSK